MQALGRRHRFETQIGLAFRWWRRHRQGNVLARTADQRRAIRRWRQRVNDIRSAHEATAEARGRLVGELQMVRLWGLLQYICQRKDGRPCWCVNYFLSWVVQGRDTEVGWTNCTAGTRNVGSLRSPSLLVGAASASGESLGVVALYTQEPASLLCSESIQKAHFVHIGLDEASCAGQQSSPGMSPRAGREPLVCRRPAQKSVDVD